MQNIPTLVVCITAGTLVVAKWAQLPRSAPWAISGFGLLLVLSIASPLARAFVTSAPPTKYVLTHSFLVLLLVDSTLHAVSYLLLLIAVLKGRPAGSPGVQA